MSGDGSSLAASRPTPFAKLLVANRGEIAIRIMRAAHQAGLATVAVHSDADADAGHVRFAGEAVRIGGAAPADSYLRIEAIITAARVTGADAIHPGYGFLAENAGLAEACSRAGIVFVGPSAHAIRCMGDKAGAKAIMLAAGVPCVPGYQGERQDDATLEAEAARTGYPLMIKATTGGGGRGMRRVEDAASFAEMLDSARSEAKAAFGDDRVLLERAIADPRHVEIQVMADRYGHAIHLGERDCSVQRRHQKLIEEAPSPAVGPELRARMGDAAVAAVKAIGYEGAGTLEFLLDRSGAFYFMEMNTRLQVEHPVTEAITGLDLVRLQLRMAAGEALELRQDDVRFSGHAMEVRLCAEDPAAGFLPRSGTLALWEPTQRLRVDHALASGAAIPPQYDSMIAKLVCHGRDREEARRGLIRGLEDTVALGVRTNQRFLADCLAHPAFAAGEATTAFVDAHLGELLPDAGEGQAGEGQVGEEEAGAACRVAAMLRAAPGSALMSGFPAPLRLVRDERTYELSVTAMPDGRVEATTGGGVEDGVEDGVAVALRVRARDGATIRYEEAGVARTARLLREGNRIHAHVAGRAWDFDDATFAPTAAAVARGDGRVRASMNGRVVALDVEVGAMVEPGQRVLALEAMKMEHAHPAPIRGRVTAVNVARGDQVEAGRVLVEIEPREG